MAKTSSGLIDYCKAQVGLPYWYGTYGQTASESLYNSKKSQYPGYYTASDFASQYGKRVHDCIGLIKGYLWSDTPTSEPTYNASQDVNCTGMYAAATVKGAISSFPMTEGALVFRGDSINNLTHVGVYSNGYVYEAKGHAYGVQRNAYTASSWNNWAECPYITYDGTSSGTTSSAEPATSTPSSGFSLAVDGQWGRNTTRAVQTILGTEVDGIVDSQYRGYASDNPGLLGESWMWVSYGYGSPMVRALQSKLGVSADGLIGPASIKALQNKYGTGADGKIDNPSPCVRAMQQHINDYGTLW